MSKRNSGVPVDPLATVDTEAAAIAPRKRGSYVTGFTRGFVSAFGTVVMVCLLALAVAIGAIPFATHGKALAVLSGSMEPTFSPGDLIVVKGVDDPSSIPINTIVTFMPSPDDPTLITHRITGKASNADGSVSYVTQGDANGAADPPIEARQVRGIYMFKIPKLGYVSNWIGGESRVAVVALGIALLGYAAYQILFARRGAKEKLEEGQADDSTGAPDKAPGGDIGAEPSDGSPAGEDAT
ncbi:MAG: signal peptidase I [Bifidobacteriaceae bacterium]|nr:signal peptidase I [Bifidobacteriaceae bacterium]